MSVVWLARDTSNQELVALKIMTAISEDDRRNLKAQERFRREIEIARSLRHPHILPIVDSGYTEYEGRSVPFLVSPYLPEGSLADLMKKGPPWQQWSLLQTADAVMQAAESLWYLHTRTPQIVHQDVKPGNFLCRSVQSVERVVHLYLCDFGISRWQSVSNMASELLGTFAFMAPEQVERKVDCASDQYALAVMACLMLTGKLPLQAATNEQYIQAHLYERPRSPSQLNPERINSPDVDAVILRALAKKPAQRFPTIREFAQQLQHALMKLVQGKATAATERLPSPSPEATSLETKRPLPLVQHPQREPDFSISIDPLEVSEGQFLDEPLPAKPLKPVVSPVKNEEGEFSLLSLKDPVRYFLPARPKMVCWSSDGNNLACALYGHVPLFLRKDSNWQEIRTTNAVYATCICWSPDGRVLAVSAQGEIRFWDVVTQVELPLVLRFNNIRVIDALDWTVSWQLAIWVENQVMVYTLPYAVLTAQVPPSPQIIATGVMRCGNVGVLRWSPDGSLLVAGASNGSVLCWTVGRQTSAWQVTVPGQKVNSLSWSQDSSLLAVAFKNNRVVGWDRRTKSQVLLWEKLPAMPRMLSISAECRIVMASSEKRLLFGFPNELFPSSIYPGQLLASWSPTNLELATLDEQRENILVIWRE